MSQAGLGLWEEPLDKGTLGAWDSGHEPSPLHTQRLKSQHHENSSSTSTTPTLSVSCTRTLRELHPPPSRLTSLIMSLGPGVLVSRGRLALPPPLSARASLPRLALARLATPSHPYSRRLGLQFAVGENSAPGYGGFLRSLHLYKRLPSQTRTRIPIVSTVIGSIPPIPPQGLVPLLGYSYNPLTWLAPYCPITLRRPRDFSTVAPLGYAQLSYCTVSLADVNALGS